MSGLITLKNVDALQIDIVQTLREQRDTILEDAAEIRSVGDEFSESIAVESLRSIKSMLKMVDNDRKDVKKPINDFAKLIERTCDEFTARLNQEAVRIGTLLNRFAVEKQLKAQEEERKRQDEVNRLAAEKQRLLNEEAAARRKEDEARLLQDAPAQVEQAKEERKEITREIKTIVKQEIQTAAAPIVAAKPEGTGLRKNPQFEILDAAKLYAAKPELVGLVPKTFEINAAIRAGLTEAPGIRIWWETAVSVRV